MVELKFNYLELRVTRRSCDGEGVAAVAPPQTSRVNYSHWRSCVAGEMHGGMGVWAMAVGCGRSRSSTTGSRTVVPRRDCVYFVRGGQRRTAGLALAVGLLRWQPEPVRDRLVVRVGE